MRLFSQRTIKTDQWNKDTHALNLPYTSSRSMAPVTNESLTHTLAKAYVFSEKKEEICTVHGNDVVFYTKSINYLGNCHNHLKHQ